MSVLLLFDEKSMINDVLLFCFPGLVVCSPDPDPKLCSSAGLVKFQNVCLSRCHGIFYRRNTKYPFLTYFLFNSSTFNFHVGAILKTLDKVNSLSSIQTFSFGENEVGKFCVLQIFGAPCVKTLIDHKKSSTTNCGR